MSKIKTLKEYQNKYKHCKQKLLTYTKADVERFQKTATQKGIEPDFLLKGKKWILIGDTYYQIPKVLSFTWFRNLKASIQVATWTILAGSVATAVGVPTYVTIQRQNTDISQKESPHIDFSDRSFDPSIPTEKQELIKKNISMSAKTIDSGDYVCKIATTGEAKNEFYQPTTVIEVKRGDKLFKENDDYTVENIDGELKVTVKSASINSTLGEIKVTPKIAQVFPTCEEFNIVGEINCDIDDTTTHLFKCVEIETGNQINNKYIDWSIVEGTGATAISEEGVITPSENGGPVKIKGKFKYRDKKEAVLDIYVASFNKLTIEEENNDYVVSIKDTSQDGKVIIPNVYFDGNSFKNVNKIDDEGFINSNISSVLIPSNINTINGNPFVNCNKLTSIIVDEENQHFTSDDSNLIRTKSDSDSTLITYTKCCETDIPSSVTKIQTRAISDRKSIKIPSSVQSIEPYGVVNCDDISQFSFSDHYTWNMSNGSSTKEIGVDDSILNINRFINSECSFAKTTNLFVKVDSITITGPTYVKENEVKDVTVQFNGGKTTPTEQDVTLSIAQGYEEYAKINEYNQVVGKKKGECKIIAKSTDSSTPIESEYSLRVTPEALQIKGKHELDINESSTYQVDNTSETINWSIKSGSQLIEEPLVIENNKAIVKPNKSGVGTVVIQAILQGTDDVKGEISISIDNYNSFKISSTGELELTEEAKKSGTGTLTLPKQYWNTSVTPAQLSDITIIKANGFNGCGYSQIVIPETIEVIGANAFEGCEALTTFSINGAVREIGDYAFKGCTALSSFNITENNSKIESLKGTFEGCTTLSSLELEKLTSLKTIDSVIKDCGAIKSIKIPSEVTSIVDDSFSDNNDIETVIIDSPTIAQGHFEGSGLFKKATTVKINDSISSMELSYIENTYQKSANKEGSYYVYCTFTIEFTSITKNVDFMVGDEFKFTESSEPFFKCILNDGTEQGITSDYTAKFINKDGVEHDVSPSSESYTFKDVDIGNGKVIIEYKGKSLDYDILIYDNAVQDITFSLASTATLDDTINNVTAVLNPTRVTLFNLEWTTDNESVLTITKTSDKTAQIKCIGVGTANVKCTDLISGKSFSKEIKIKNYVILKSIYTSNKDPKDYDQKFNNPLINSKVIEGNGFNIGAWRGKDDYYQYVAINATARNKNGTTVGTGSGSAPIRTWVYFDITISDWSKLSLRDEITVEVKHNKE